MDLCVHCGFCLQACPTYLALEDENDSPRGRIVLMHALLDGDVSATDPALNTHIERCLGCRGCETACPSGVPFGHLLEATRATLRETRPVPLVARILLGVFARPVLLRPFMAIGRLLRRTGLARVASRWNGRVGSAFAMLAASAPGPFSRTQGRGASTADDVSRAESLTAAPTAVLFEGCVMRELYGHVHVSTRAVLGANGFRLDAARGQGCCGALHAHSGDLQKARALARRNIEAFENANAAHVVVNAAGCGAMLREYEHLLGDEPGWAARARQFSARVKDITEVLAMAGPRRGAPLDVTVVYDAPCHLQHAQRVVNEPLAMFAAVPGIRLLQLPDSDQCCGAAGIYNLVQPETSAAVLSPKLSGLLASGADVICTGNPGCMMQIGAGMLRSGSGVPVAHPVELLDYSYRRERD
jgi:glycolate oxidase iron-sulfur subunit